MDRNSVCNIVSASTKVVALRKESVDRNFDYIIRLYRRIVALRKESVDRNKHTEPAEQTKAVALRKESVDRNNAMQIIVVIVYGRSPQGERG